MADELKLGLQLGYWTAQPPDPKELIERARRAEALGFDSVWTGESWSSDAFTPLAWIAAHTDRLNLATGIAQMSARSPVTMAMHAMTLDSLSGGRFRLGIGVSGPQVVEGWYGRPFSKPLARTREYVQIIRDVLAREAPVTNDGPHYPLPYRGPDAVGLGKPLKSITHPPRADIPIYTAAVQKGMSRMAGDVADGLIGHIICSAQWIEQEIVPAFELGLSRSGRDRSSFTYLPSICVAIDDDYQRGLEAARKTLAFYSTVKTYLPLYELHGFGQNAADAGAAFRKGDLAGVAAAIPDEMVETYCAVGTPDKVREKVAEVAGFGDGILPGAPTYFIPNEQIVEYNERIIEVFGN